MMGRVMERHQSPGNLAFVDMEMTGLDPQVDVILQAAVIITTPELEPLEEYVCDVWQPAAALAGMSPFVRDMHEKSGLLERLAQSRIDTLGAERRLLERIAGWCPYPATLCGNSVGQDKRFIERYMPGLGGYLHYRIVDVTSVKVLGRLWYGESVDYRKPEEGAHDALFDIQQSIAELKHYRKSFFR